MANATVIFSGSNDGSSWTVLSSTVHDLNSGFTVSVANTTAYRYFRVEQDFGGSGDLPAIGNIQMAATAPANATALSVSTSVRINDAYTLPTTDGTANQLLTTDGAGNASWTTVAPNTDNQTLSFTGTNLSVSSGNSVDLASLQDDMGNHSASQDVVLNGNMLSNDGGSEGVTLDDNGELLVSAAFQRPARFRNSLNGHASYIR